MKSYSSNLFGAQALILILMMLSTLKIQAFDINRFDQSNAFALGEDLVAMPFGMQLLEANNADADELVIGSGIITMMVIVSGERTMDINFLDHGT